MPFDYGRCPYDQAAYEARTVEVRPSAGGPVTHLTDTSQILLDVSQGYCPVCRSRVYKAGILARIEAVMKGESDDPALRRS